LQLSCNLQLSC